MLNQASESELRALRDLLQKVFLKKRLAVPGKLYRHHRKQLDFLVKKLDGKKVNRVRELRKIALRAQQALAELVKLLL